MDDVGSNSESVKHDIFWGVIGITEVCFLTIMCYYLFDIFFPEIW